MGRQLGGREDPQAREAVDSWQLRGPEPVGGRGGGLPLDSSVTRVQELAQFSNPKAAGVTPSHVARGAHSVRLTHRNPSSCSGTGLESHSPHSRRLRRLFIN